jgi:hypothetical protein
VFNFGLTQRNNKEGMSTFFTIRLRIDRWALHYLPWSFVAHDRLWNLVPVPRAINSAKGASIPDQGYLGKLAVLQSAAISATASNWPRKKWVESIEAFLVDLRLDTDSARDEARLCEALKRSIRPLEAIAEGQGFQAGWVYREFSS